MILNQNFLPNAPAFNDWNLEFPQYGLLETEVESENSIDWLLAAYRQEKTPDSATAAEDEMQALIETLRNPLNMQRLVEDSENESLDPLVKKDFGDFELLGHLGSGGMGQVFRARHKRLGRVQALKLLPPDRVTNAQALKRFEREMQAIGQLRHPSFVIVHDAGHFDGTPYIAMELIEGKTFGQIVREAKLAGSKVGVAQACEWIANAALAVQHAHDNNVLHRDIKPANLMLDRDSQVKVLDLGLAKLTKNRDYQSSERDQALSQLGNLDSLTADHQILGTPDFMAPEQINGVPDPRTDVYSLAATLHFLLTGDVLFGDSSHGLVGKAVAVVQKPAPRARKRRPDVPDALDQLLQRSLSKKPEERPQSATEFAILLRPFTDTDVSSHDSFTDCLSDEGIGRSSQTAHSGDVDSPTRISKWWLALAPILLGFLGIILVFRGPDGATLTIECNDPNLRVNAEWIGNIESVSEVPTAYELGGDDSEVELITGPWRIQIVGDLAGKFELSENEFVLKKGEKKVVSVSVIESKASTTDPDVVVTPNRGGSVASETIRKPIHITPVINPKNYASPSQSQLATYANVLPQTGFIPREIIRPGLPLEGIQMVSDENMGPPRETGLLTPPTVSPTGRYLVWLTYRDGAIVKDLDTDKLTQFTPGNFRSARWGTFRDTQKADENLPPEEYLILTPIDLKHPVEIRLANGQLVRRIKISGKLHDSGSYFGSADVHPIPGTEYLFIWSQNGACIFDWNGQVKTSIESEVFSKMFANDPKNCGHVAFLKTNDKSKPWAFLFVSADEFVRRWHPEIQLAEDIDTARTAKLFEVNLDNNESQGEIEDWFRWEENATPIKIGFISVSPEHQKILLSSGWGQEHTLILGPDKKRLASAEIRERFAFNPAGYLLVDGKGQIYNEHLESQNEPEFNLNELKKYPYVIENQKQPFWAADSKIHLATISHEFGVYLFAATPGKKFSLVSKAPAASYSHLDSSNHGEIGISVLHVSSTKFGWRSQNYFATFDSLGKFQNKTTVNRIGSSHHMKRSQTSKNWLLYSHHGNVDLMTPGGEKIATFNNVNRSLWSPSGEHLLIGTPEHLTIYDANGNEKQKLAQHPDAVPYMNHGHHRWSKDRRFWIDCCETSVADNVVIPIVFDFKTGKKTELTPQSVYEPIEISDDSKWLCIRRRFGQSPNLTVVNLETGELTQSTNSSGGGRQVPAFAFSSRTDEAVTLDGVFEIEANGALKKITPLKLPKDTSWKLVAVVDSEGESANSRESHQPKMLILDDNPGVRRSYAWAKLDEKPILRPLNPYPYMAPFETICSSDCGVMKIGNNCLAFLPLDAEQPTHFARMFPDHSILLFDEFGNVQTEALTSDINDYLIRTFNYSGGRVVPLNEEEYQARIAATPDQKIQNWLNDLGIEYEMIDGAIVKVVARDLAELSGTDLGVISLLPSLKELSIVGCPNSDAIPLPTRNFDSLTDLTIRNFENADRLPELLSKCPNLEHLDIAGTRFPQLFVSNIVACKKLKTIEASKDFLTDSVQSDISSKLPNCSIKVTE